MKRIQFEATTEGNILHTVDNVICATVKVPEGASEDYGYMTMKNAIIKALAERGITEEIEWWYDEASEANLEADANDGDPEVEIDEDATMKKTVYIARESDDNTDTVKAFWSREAAAQAADMMLYHLTDRERKSTTVSIERYDLETDATTAEEAFKAALDADDPAALNAIEYDEVRV